MILKIKVKPNSGKQEVNNDGENLLISLKSAPENNQANIELLKLLAKHFKVSSDRIKILRGKTSKNKIVEIKE